jgi:signal transduction histidine kinase
MGTDSQPFIRQGYPLAGGVEEWVRFDDMLATVLARPAEKSAERVALWRQLIDLLAQRRPGADPALSREAFLRLQALRPDVPIAIRCETARAFAGRSIRPVLAAFLAADVPAVAGAILPHVRLDEAGWLEILPRLTPTGRGFLRHRRDLGPQVEAALWSFGATDLALGGGTVPAQEASAPQPMQSAAGDPLPPPVSVEHGVGEGQIRAIITRIARFRKGREGQLPEPEPEQIASFRFETGPDGVICWVDGAPRGPLVGETIATPAAGIHGVDAQAPGAFRRRAPFREARLMIAGRSGVSGEWRIAGVPVFGPSDGRFLGYRGTARRPREDERAEPEPDVPGLYGGGLEPDSLRQLVHELRTPLNAIGGFAEMIRRQMRGPVSTSYRDRAQNIAEQAGQLLAAVDDLDVAARLETRRLDLQRVEIDLGTMLALISDNHAKSAARRGGALECAVTPDLPPVTGDPAALRRMIGRLIGASAALTAEGETIRVTLSGGGSPTMLELTVRRPARLDGQDDAALFDTAHGPDGDWPDAPLLGLGFSLHLVRRLASAAGGGLRIEPDRFVLSLPASEGRATGAEPGAER